MNKQKNQSVDSVTSLLGHLPIGKFSVAAADMNPVDTDRAIRLDGLLCESLAHPIDFPPLDQAVFLEDRVAVSLQAGLPEARLMLNSLLNWLQQHGINELDTVVVIPPTLATEFDFSDQEISTAVDPDAKELPLIHQRQFLGHQVNFQIHNAHNQAGVSYIAANQAGDPIYINRQLVDADVIIPVGFHSAGDVTNQHDCIYPEFSLQDVQQRLRGPHATSRKHLAEVQMANENLGSFFVLQVASRPGSQIDRIFYGSRESAVRQAIQATNQLWEFSGPFDRQVPLATIESVETAATWDDFIEAVILANQVAPGSAPIVVWSELHELPRKAVQQAFSIQFENHAKPSLSPKLEHFLNVLQERPIYLRSQLPRDDIENLGLGYFDSYQQIDRLMENWESGVVIRDAHRRQVDSGRLKRTVANAGRQ